MRQNERKRDWKMSSIYLSNAIFMMIILTIIFLRIRYYITWSPSKKYTMIFIGMVELYVLMDALFMKELLQRCTKGT